MPARPKYDFIGNIRDRIKGCAKHHQKSTICKISTTEKSSKQKTVSSTTKWMENKKRLKDDAAMIKRRIKTHVI